MIELNATILSKGYCIGKIFFAEERLNLTHKELFLGKEQEAKRLSKALSTVHHSILKTIENLKEKKLFSESEIFESHLLILDDPDFLEKMDAFMNSSSAEESVAQAVCFFEKQFADIEDEYIRQRLTDLKDIENRILNALNSEQVETMRENRDQENFKKVYFSTELTPSQTTSLDHSAGFLTSVGGVTSHAAILARALGVPALTGIQKEQISEGSVVCVDGFEGKVYLNPTEVFMSEFDRKISNYELEKKNLEIYSSLKSVTKSGMEFSLEANIGSQQDLDVVIASGADGIGLFRTEFLFMNKSSAPTEEEQFLIYSNIFKRFQKPIKIRTFDVGGDKKISYLKTEFEENPFLGIRGARLYFQYKDIFKSQIRAILRAAVFHSHVGVMIPMVSTEQEVRSIFGLIEECILELKSSEYEFQPKIELGIMVEVPSIIYSLPKLKELIDFVSIGTNDLSQYLFAADRGLKSLSAFHDGKHPEFMTALKSIIKECNNMNIPCSICGDLGAQVDFLPDWIEMGLHRLSMPAIEIPAYRKALSLI